MRLLTFRSKEGLRVGVILDQGVVDLTARLSLPTVRSLLEQERLSDVKRIASGSPCDYRLDEIEFDLPLTDPAKILCVGVNYMGRNTEYRDGSAPPQYPSLFMRTPLSLVPHGQPIVIPSESTQLDYEGEIVLVIGKPGRRIPRTAAIGHLAGITIMNDGSVRDWLRHGKFNVTQGKNFDRSGGLGPWIETDLGDLDLVDLRIETRVNGELRQSDTTAAMAFPFDRLIEYISTFATLLPGDLIATGTPTGAGARFDPPKWLLPGDSVEVEVAGVGLLKNGVVQEGRS